MIKRWAYHLLNKSVFLLIIVYFEYATCIACYLINCEKYLNKHLLYQHEGNNKIRDVHLDHCYKYELYWKITFFENVGTLYL